MTVVGAWPNIVGDQTITVRCFLFIHFILILMMMVMPQVRRAIMVRKDFNALLEVLSTGIFMESIGLLKILGFGYNQKGMKEVLVEIANDWRAANAKDQSVIWRYCSKGRTLTKMCLTLTLGNVCAQFFRVMALYFIELHNAIGNQTVERPMMIKSDFYFDLQHSSINEIVMSVQIAACFSLAVVYTAYDGFFVYTILHFSSQLYLLKERIERIVEDAQERKCSFMSLFIPIIHKHQRLYRYTNILEDFNKIFLVHMLATSILLCLQSYELAVAIDEINSKMLPQLTFFVCFVSSNIASIFVYCYVAEQLRTESESLFTAVGKIAWYDLPPNESRLLIIFMCRTKVPIEITVGKFVPFSLQYFCSVLKTSAGYLSVLLAMKDRL